MPGAHFERIGRLAVVLAEKTEATPRAIIEICKQRLRRRAVAGVELLPEIAPAAFMAGG